MQSLDKDILLFWCKAVSPVSCERKCAFAELLFLLEMKDAVGNIVAMAVEQTWKSLLPSQK